MRRLDRLVCDLLVAVQGPVPKIHGLELQALRPNLFPSQVGEMWDREGPDVAGSVGSKRQSGMGGHSHHKGGSATGGSSFAIADAPAVAPQKVVKKRDYVLDDGTLVGPPSTWTIFAIRAGAIFGIFWAVHW
jgi:hypothetical protein